MCAFSIIDCVEVCLFTYALHLPELLNCNQVQTVEEQVRAAAEHKLGVANQSITAGFFDNNTR